MTPEQRTAVRRLALVLDAENSALEALDYHRVGEFADEKRLALAALDSLPAPGPKPTEPDPLAIELGALVTRNRTLLARAIKVQNRIMGVVATAARQSQVPAGYGARGNRPRPTSTGAVALIVRA